MSKYYYHGIREFSVAISKVLDVLTTGGIKCKRLLGEKTTLDIMKGIM